MASNKERKRQTTERKREKDKGQVTKSMKLESIYAAPEAGGERERETGMEKQLM